MTKIQAFCLYTPLKVLAITLQLSVLLIWPVSWMGCKFPVWLRSDMGGWNLRVILLVNGFVALFSSTLALNIYQSVRKNAFLSFLTFFLPFVVVYGVILSNIPQSGAGYTLFVFSAFLIPQIYYYIRLRKRLRLGDFE